MKKEDCFQLGYISKTHGFKGEVIFLSNGKTSIKLNKLESVFIEINGQLIPFFIESLKQATATSEIIKFCDIDTEEKARQLIKCNIYILSSLIPKQNEDNFNPFELIGFKVIDDVHGEIGEITNILEMPQQLIFEIHKVKKEILIPANENIIYKIDSNKKIVFINTPEGLIDIYLDSKD